MPLFLPSMLPTVEIEERRPKTWNEPRRKRLSFVRPHTPKDHRGGSGERKSDDWALVPRPGHHAPAHHRMATDAETWDRRQWEAQGRFAQQDHLRRMHALQFQHAIQQQQLAHLGHHHLQPRIEERAPRGHRRGRSGPLSSDSDDSDAIIAVVSGSSSSEDSGDDISHHLHRIRPRRISKSRDRAELPKIIKVGGGGKKAGKKGSKKKADDSDSDDEDAGMFVEGFRAGRRASMHDRRSSRGGSARGRRPRFERHDDSDSDDSMDFRRRSRRSRSRGMPWGF